MRKYNRLLFIIGMLAFIFVICSGSIWILSIFNISFSFFTLITDIVKIILIAIIFLSGWLWLISSKINRGIKIFLMIIFIIFSILALCGIL